MSGNRHLSPATGQRPARQKTMTSPAEQNGQLQPTMHSRPSSATSPHAQSHSVVHHLRSFDAMAINACCCSQIKEGAGGQKGVHARTLIGLIIIHQPLLQLLRNQKSRFPPVEIIMGAYIQEGKKETSITRPCRAYTKN